MPVSVTVRDFWRAGNRTMVVGSLTFSGNYDSGGIPVALTGLFPGNNKNVEIIRIEGDSDHNYQFLRATGRIRIRNAGGTELTAGSALPTAVTGDSVDFIAVARQ